MEIAYDRYAPRGGTRHVDLATGQLVDIAVRDVPDSDWRRRWRVRVAALLAPCRGLEALVDAGESGPHQVFEVRAHRRMVGPTSASSVHPDVAAALVWLKALALTAGPCAASRLLPDGRLCADRHTAWPIETPEEQAAAGRLWRQWTRRAGHAAGACVSPEVLPAPSTYDELEEWECRTGLIELALPPADALRFARATGRVAVGPDVDPARMPADLKATRSFVVVDAGRSRAAAWAASLAAASGRRHYVVPACRRRWVARERALAYAVERPGPGSRALSRAGQWGSRQARAHLATARAQLARGRITPAVRTAGRAAQLAGTHSTVRVEAVLVKAQSLRASGAARDASALLEAELRDNPCASTAAFLVEAAEAACDSARLQPAEAFARAALLAAADTPSHHRARLALDRVRLWRGEPVETDFWQARARWQTWGATPAWPPHGGYTHAPRGRLAAWEHAVDGLERARWYGDAGAAARIETRLARERDAVPALLKARIAWLVSHDAGPARRSGAAGVLQTGKAGAVMEIFDHMSALLGVCHDSATDETAMAAAVARTRQILRARSAAVYVPSAPLPVAGDGSGWNAPSPLASRCIASAQTSGPEREGSLLAAGASIRGPEGPAGALLVTWTPNATVEARRVRLLLEAAALVIAPVVRAWTSRVEAPPHADMPEIIGVSPAIGAVRDAVRRVAAVPFAVLIEGESGVGKELVARAIHRLSSRAPRPFRALNCAAMAEELVEAELFGHAQGAYTGAASARAGLFEDADRGTLFLDEVSELSPRAQAKLLRVLQEGEVRRVGEAAARRIDVRIVAASNRPLAAAVAAGAFRSDLLFRLDVLRILVPPLRERAEDIPLLCAHFWREAASRAGTSAQLTPDAIGLLAAYAWPGNVRELQNVIAATAVSCPRRGRAGLEHLPAHLQSPLMPRPTLHQARAALERDLVRAALARAGGRSGRAAAELGVSRQGLAKLMRRLGLPVA